MAIDFESADNDYLKYTGTGTDFDNMTALTVGIFVKPESVTGTHDLFSKWDFTDTDKSFLLYHSASTGKVRLEVAYDDGSSTDLVNGNFGLNANGEWWCYFGRWTTSEIAVFGGQPGPGKAALWKASSIITRTSITDSSADLALASQHDQSNHFDGLMAFACIWKNKALSDEEIRGIARGTHPMQVERGSMQFFCSMLDTNHIDDESGHGYAGTLEGGPVTLSDMPPTGLLFPWGVGDDAPADVAAGDAISDAGGIASAESFGTAVISVGPVTISDAGGIASAEDFGTATLTPTYEITDAGGIASAEAFGTATISVSGAISGAGGISSAEAFGTAVISVGHVSITGAGGIAPLDSPFGTATLDLSYELTNAGNIASAETFGTAVISVGGVEVTPSGIASAEAFGTAVISLSVSITSAGGITSGEAFGTATITVATGELTNVGGIASLEAFGTAFIGLLGAIQSAGGIGTSEAFGTAIIGTSFNDAGGIPSAEAFGTHAIVVARVAASAGGIGSQEAFGTAVISTSGGGVTISNAGGIGTEERFGVAIIGFTLGWVSFKVGSIFTVNANERTVTFGVPPLTGTDNIEIVRQTRRGGEEESDAMALSRQAYMVAAEVEDQLADASHVMAHGSNADPSSASITMKIGDRTMEVTGVPMLHKTTFKRVTVSFVQQGTVDPGDWTLHLNKNPNPSGSPAPGDSIATFAVEIAAAVAEIKITEGEWSKEVDMDVGDYWTVSLDGPFVDAPAAIVIIGVRYRTPRLLTT